MKKITQKILAGILTLAMVLGCFGGMGTLEVKAAGTITIESITAQSSTVSKNGGDVSFSVKGTNVPNKLFYKLGWPGGFGTSWSGAGEVTVADSDGAKKITINFQEPKNEQQTEWKVRVCGDNKFNTGTYLETSIPIADEQPEPTATKEELGAAIVQAEIKTEADYTKESWEVFLKALADARTTRDNSSATGADFKKAIDALNDAESKLVKLGYEKQRILKITVQDEKTKEPVSSESNLKLQLVKGEDKRDVTMDSEGIITINVDEIGNDIILGEYYLLKATDDSKYTCSDVMTVRFQEGNVLKKPYIDKVILNNNSQKLYATTQLTINVKETKTKINSVSTTTTLVKNKGQVEVRVDGMGIPEELYYGLSYTKAAGSNTGYAYNRGEMNPIAATGENDTSKTIKVTLPEKPTGTYAWKINVAASKTDTAYSTGWIRVVEEATKEELQAAIDAFSGKTASDYTEETWESYNSAVEKGKEVAGAESEVTALEYGAALADIREAEDELLLKAATSNTTLRIKAEDEEGNPALKIMFEIKNGFKSLYFPETDEDGRAAYTMNGTETNSTGNTILLMDNAKYECDIPITVDFYVMSTGSDYKRYIKKFVVDGKKIGPEEEAVIVVKRKPEIFKAVSSVDTADEDGESATITLTGVKLQETVYYDLYGTDRKGKKTYAAEKQEVQTAGTGNTERTFEVAVPAISEYPEIISWTVVAYPTKDSTSGASVKINTTNDPVTEETMEKLNAAVKDAARLKEADYTPASWKAYQEAIQAAKAVLGNEKSTETEYRNALKVLTDAKAVLVAKSGGTVQEYKVTKIQITGASRKIAAGKKIQLTASVLPSNASNKAVKWTTSNKKYATVDSKGKVSAKKAGAGKSVTITATAADGSGVKATYKIKIQKDAVKSITLKAKKTVKAGKTLKVKATVKTTGKKANKTLKWTSSNTKYATVSSKGVVKAKKAGKGRKVKITASATDGSGKKKTVTVKIK